MPIYGHAERSPRESREILILQLLRVFWDEKFMEVEIRGFHTALGDLLKRLRRVPPKVRVWSADEMHYLFDEKTGRFPLIDDILALLSIRGLISTEISGEQGMIRFHAETGRKILRELSDEYRLLADENTVSLEPCRGAVEVYKKLHSSHQKDCDE